MHKYAQTEHAAEYLSVEHTAQLLDVSTVTIRRKIAESELPAVQLGGPGSSIRIPRRALEDRLEHYRLDGPEAT